MHLLSSLDTAIIQILSNTTRLGRLVLLLTNAPALLLLCLQKFLLRRFCLYSEYCLMSWPMMVMLRIIAVLLKQYNTGTLSLSVKNALSDPDA